MEKVKLGLIVSHRFYDDNRITDYLYGLFKRYGKTNIEILYSIQKYDDNLMVRIFSNEFGVTYYEFPPHHQSHNQYCILSPSKYGKKFNK